MEDSQDNSVVHRMPIETEFRFVVGEDTTDVKLELLDGFAEIFGSELERSKVYSFLPSSSVSVFTWMGCTIRLTGEVESSNLTSDTRMIIPVNLHACLEEMRVEAETNKKKGPVSLIVGPTDVGKSTLCRFLLNYAARLGRRPVYIDLDVGQSSASIPGTISVLPVERQSHVTEGFSEQAMTVYPFGYKSPGHNIALYYLMIKKLGQLVKSRMENANLNTRHSGIIIDSCGWVRGAGYQAITLAACSFEIDVLFVVQEGRLFEQLRKDMPDSVEVVYVPIQEGVYERSRMQRSKSRDNRVWEYFYGVNGDLNPHSITVKFDEILIYKVSQTSPEGNIDARNISADDVAIVSVALAPNLINQVLGLSFANSVDENIMVTNIIGFVCVVNVDLEKDDITVLSPQPGPLPSKIMLMGDVRLHSRT